MIRFLKVLTMSSIVNTVSLVGMASSESFETMKQAEDAWLECEAPRPPEELDSFAYVRNGYREILRITAIRSTLDARDCGCPFEQVDWTAVIATSEEFKTSDNPKLPFDVIDLRSRADALETEFAEACGK